MRSSIRFYQVLPGSVIFQKILPVSKRFQLLLDCSMRFWLIIVTYLLPQMWLPGWRLWLSALFVSLAVSGLLAVGSE